MAVRGVNDVAEDYFNNNNDNNCTLTVVDTSKGLNLWENGPGL